jgi:hypothetical protein
VEGLRCSTHKRLRCSSIGFAEVKKLAGTRKSRTSSRILATLGGILRPPASCQPKVSTTLGAFIELAPTGSEVVYGGILSWKARVCLTVAISESSFIGQREGIPSPMPPSSPAHSYRQCPWCGRSFKAYPSWGQRPVASLHVHLPG